MNAELLKLKKHVDEYTVNQRDKEIDDAVHNVWEHKKSLILDIDRLKKADGYDEWREKESKDLTDLVQRRFK